MTFNPEGFADMKDKYFLLNGRSYPDTVTPGPLQTQSADGAYHFSQPLPSIINIPAGGKALLRISDLDVTEYPDAGLAGHSDEGHRDQRQAAARSGRGNNLYYNTNSITLGGGESLDVILDSDATYPAGTFYLYTPNLDHLVERCRELRRLDDRSPASTRSAAMRATNMKKAISKTQLLLAPIVVLALLLAATAHRCGSRHHRPDLQPDGATGLHHPARRADGLLVGVRLQRRRRAALLLQRSPEHSFATRCRFPARR